MEYDAAPMYQTTRCHHRTATATMAWNLTSMFLQYYQPYKVRLPWQQQLFTYVNNFQRMHFSYIYYISQRSYMFRPVWAIFRELYSKKIKC